MRALVMAIAASCGHLSGPGFIPPPRSSLHHSPDSTWVLALMPLVMGAFSLGLYLYVMPPLGKSMSEILRWWKDPRRKILRRVKAVVPVGSDELVPGAVVAITGRILRGEGAAPRKLSGRLVLEDGSGRCLQVGEGDVGGLFETGDTIFAVGTLRRPAEGQQNPGAESYRSGVALDVLAPGPDGLFFVAKGPRERALRDLEQATAPPRLPPAGLAVFGAVSLLLGLWLLLS